MKTRGLAVDSSTSPLKTFEFDRREVGAHDVALDVKFTGICHSDIHGPRRMGCSLLSIGAWPRNCGIGYSGRCIRNKIQSW